MRPQVRPLDDRDAEAVVSLSLRAWAPVFASIEQALGLEIYGLLFPDGWLASQRQAVEAVCASQEKRVWVAEADAGRRPVGSGQRFRRAPGPAGLGGIPRPR